MCFTYQCQMVGRGVDLVGMSGQKKPTLCPQILSHSLCWVVCILVILMSILYMANDDFGNCFFFTTCTVLFLLGMFYIMTSECGFRRLQVLLISLIKWTCHVLNMNIQVNKLKQQSTLFIPIVNLISRVLRLLGQWVVTRKDSGVMEKKYDFLIGCSQ